jgi:ABC-type phosphate/phosphonate transport system substrate-binding protein
MIAALGMYDRAETAAAHDRLWTLIRDEMRVRGLAAPEALTRGAGAYWGAWQSPDLALSQTCGFPYRSRLHGHVTLIGTPDYGLPGCPPGYYNSVFVARADDLRTLPEFRMARFAYNDGLSQSGWAAPQNHAATMGFQFQPSLASGGHRLSALAVAESRADIAAVDAMTWALLQSYEPWIASLREVARTAPTPGLPYIAAKTRDAAASFAAVQAAIDALAEADRTCLHLKGIVRIEAARYLAIPSPLPPEQMALDHIAQGA